MSCLRNPDTRDALIPEMTSYVPSIELACLGQSFFSTSTGIGAGNTKPGDMICVFEGCVTPFIIRRLDDEQADLCSVLGESYGDGVMSGEALEMEEARKTTTFPLI